MAGADLPLNSMPLTGAFHREDDGGLSDATALAVNGTVIYLLADPLAAVALTPDADANGEPYLFSQYGGWPDFRYVVGMLSKPPLSGPEVPGRASGSRCASRSIS